GAGLLLDRKHPRHVADAVNGLLGDPTECGRLAGKGRARVAAMDLPDVGHRLVAAVRSVADGGDSPAPRAAPSERGILRAASH
ncbi:MAG: hypothetical protein ACYCV7_06090, partial [Acidimicrobiales bacterium]